MSRKSGFTLVELVVVVLILGILAAIAVPKIISNADDASESGAAQTLASVRDAVELYATQPGWGGYPKGTGTEVVTKLLPLIRGSKFPKVKIGGLTVSNSNDTIKISPTLTVTPGNPTATTEGWVYAPATGEIIINSDVLLSDGTTKYSEL